MTYIITQDKLIKDFNLSPYSAGAVLECVKAGKGYEQLPPATQKDLQTICNMHGLRFTFNVTTNNKLYLTGIYNQVQACLLGNTEIKAKRHNQYKDKTLYSAINYDLLPTGELVGYITNSETGDCIYLTGNTHPKWN